jgi:hypothetical protein
MSSALLSKDSSGDRGAGVGSVRFSASSQERIDQSVAVVKRGRGRPVAYPRSVLDRRALLDALDEAGISVKMEHLDGFYQALHRSHYPSLEDFVTQYYRNERDVQMNKIQKQNTGNPAREETTPGQEQETTLPLKNSVSNKKNRNRKNLPKAFLEFLMDPDNGFTMITSKVAQVKTSADGSTTKLAVQLHDGQLVESVLMRYGPKEEGVSVRKSGRAALCVSRYVPNFGKKKFQNCCCGF